MTKDEKRVWVLPQGEQTEQVLIAIGEMLDEHDLQTWPPIIPSVSQIVERSGLSRAEVENIFRKHASTVKDPLFARPFYGRIALTPKAIAWLYYRGYLRKFVIASDKGVGIAIPRLEIHYPT